MARRKSAAAQGATSDSDNSAESHNPTNAPRTTPSAAASETIALTSVTAALGAVADAFVVTIWERPVTSFLVASCVWSWIWLGSLLAREAEDRSPTLRLLATSLAGSGPPIVAAAFVAFTEEQAGFIRITQTQAFAAHSPWLWLATLAPFAAYSLGALASARMYDYGGNPEELDSPLGADTQWSVLLDHAAPRLLHIAPHALGIGFSLALGWWAFLTPHILRTGNAPIKTGMLIGLLWGFWALPMHWLDAGEAAPGLHGPMIVALLSYTLVPTAMFVTALYLSSHGSLPLLIAALTVWEASRVAFSDRLQEPYQPTQRLEYAAWTSLAINVILGAPAALVLWRLRSIKRRGRG